MPDKHLNIISFTVPHPPNYGGVIDVFYKLKALHAAGIKIHLHCFVYNRPPAPELETYCESVCYYKRRTDFMTFMSLKPQIVKSRQSRELLSNLESNNFPVLFEGLHTCYLLSGNSLEGRRLIYRESNIEHEYYFELAKLERNILHKIFFFVESIKLRFLQRYLVKASSIVTVTQKDANYLKQVFPEVNVITIPSFHGNAQVQSQPGRGKYVLFHGNLSVAENYKAAQYLVKEVFDGSGMQLVIAGLDPPLWLEKATSAHQNITLISNPSENEMDELIRNAHINILITQQDTGLKIKLLNALYKGRFVVANSLMVSGTGLETLCIIVNSAEETRNTLAKLFEMDFTEQEIIKRRSILESDYNDTRNCRKLTELIFSF